MSRARNSRWNEAGIYGGQNKIGVHVLLVYHVGIAIYT